MKATHYIAQYQKVANRQTFRAEIFYKKYDNLVKTGTVEFTESQPLTIMVLEMQKELSFSGEIRKQLKILITGFLIPTWIQKEIF